MKYRIKKSSGLWTEFLGSLVFELIEGRFVSMGGSCSFEYEIFKNHFYQEVTDTMVDEWFRDMMEIVTDYECMKIKKS